MIFRPNSAEMDDCEYFATNFECDQCGACCQKLIISAYTIDLLREPKLRDHMHPEITITGMNTGEQEITLYDENTRQCPFLTVIDNPDTPTTLPHTCTCQIYASRPNPCVALLPGDPKCQQARLLKSLPPLFDKYGNTPDKARFIRYGVNNYSPDVIQEVHYHVYGVPIIITHADDPTDIIDAINNLIEQAPPEETDNT